MAIFIDPSTVFLEIALRVCNAGFNLNLYYSKSLRRCGKKTNRALNFTEIHFSSNTPDFSFDNTTFDNTAYSLYNFYYFLCPTLSLLF
jgi:hypothetical protein